MRKYAIDSIVYSFKYIIYIHAFGRNTIDSKAFFSQFEPIQINRKKVYNRLLKFA